MKFKKLVIAPHADDEVLGCGGILDSDTFVFYCGINENAIRNKDEHRIPGDDRKKEVENVSNFFGFEYEINEENLVNNYKLPSIVGQIEAIINRTKPEMVIIPFPSYNQDHKTVYDAARIALRPHDTNWFVNKVLTYEQPHSIMWEEGDLKVNYFKEIDVERKIKGYLLHASQVREFRSPGVIKAIAKVRGKSICKDYAEGYKIERWVDK